jgi:hypothetical protein
MKRFCQRLFCLCAVIAAAAGAGADMAGADEPDPDSRPQPRAPGEHPARPFPRFAGQSVVLCISVRVMESDRVETWTQSERQVTIPGRPVEVKILGANIVVAMQVTPYERRMGSARSTFLVVQGQIWMDTPDRGIRYHASMQTIPVQLGEPVYFFPLGPVRDGMASIEMILTVREYDEEEDS